MNVPLSWLAARYSSLLLTWFFFEGDILNFCPVFYNIHEVWIRVNRSLDLCYMRNFPPELSINLIRSLGCFKTFNCPPPIKWLPEIFLSQIPTNQYTYIKKKNKSKGVYNREVRPTFSNRWKQSSPLINQIAFKVCRGPPDNSIFVFVPLDYRSRVSPPSIHYVPLLKAILWLRWFVYSFRTIWNQR